MTNEFHVDIMSDKYLIFSAELVFIEALFFWVFSQINQGILSNSFKLLNSSNNLPDKMLHKSNYMTSIKDKII